MVRAIKSMIFTTWKYGYGTGTGGVDVGVREGVNLRPKTLICGGGDRYGGRYIKRRERREERRGRREEDGGEKDRKAVRKEGEGREGKDEEGVREARGEM